MSTRSYMIVIKDEIKTSEIMSCMYNRDTGKWGKSYWHICFGDGMLMYCKEARKRKQEIDRQRHTIPRYGNNA